MPILKYQRAFNRAPAPAASQNNFRREIMSRGFNLKDHAFKFAAAAVVLISAAIIFAAPARAQQRVLTTADYARAEKFMGYNTTPLVLNTIGGGGRGGGRGVNWLPDERFTYAVTTGDGTEFI